MKTIKHMTKILIFNAILLSSALINAQQGNTILIKGAQIQISPILSSVLKQAETVYVNPTGFTMNNFYNDAPDVIPTFLGLIVYRQEMIMDENKNLKDFKNASALEDEIVAFLVHLAQAHNYRNPADNTGMPAAMLNVLFLEAVRGDQNANFANNMGIDPTKVQITYLLDKNPSVNTPAGEHGKLILKGEKNNEIILFGEVPGDATKRPKTKKWQDVAKSNKAEGLICPEKNPEDNQSFLIDTNNNPNDRTYVKCNYFGSYTSSNKNNFLESQFPKVNGKQHGIVYLYKKTESGTRYLSGKYSYVNGKQHGITELYKFYNNKPYIYSYTEYSNGKKNGADKHWATYPFYHQNYSNNYTYGIKDGRQEDYSTTKNGRVYLSSEEYFINGVMKTAYRYDSKGKIIPALSSPN